MKTKHPDFTGAWVMNKSESHLEIAAPDSTTFTVRHDDPALTIERTHQGAGIVDAVSLALRIDGAERELDVHGVAVKNRTWWEGDEIVSDSRLPRGGAIATNLVRYSLSDDGGTFTAEERFEGEGLAYHNHWVFDRQTFEPRS